MQSPANQFRFESVTFRDRTMLTNWLSIDSSQEWWGNPAQELRLIFEGERTGESRGFIAHHSDHGPFAYIQCWDPSRVPDHLVDQDPWVRDQAAGTLGVDITIGVPTLLGKGLGSQTVFAFGDMLFAEGTPRLIIDPDARNTRAVRAYEKAGFTRFNSHTNADGSITLLMERLPPKD